MLVALSCGGESVAPPATLVVEPASTLLVGVGSTVRLRADASGGSGPVVWSSSDASVATVDQGVVTSVAVGVATISARLSDLAATARVEVFIPEDIAELVPGAVHRGRGGYTEMLVGGLPVVLSAPHGGELTPDEIPDRTEGSLLNDLYTRELTLAVRDALVVRTGAAPFVVLSRLKRVKLDPNREIGEAAGHNVFAEHAWSEYHGFIEMAEAEIAGRHGRGLYVDLHGHAHPANRLELGYLLSASDLEGPDAALDLPAMIEKSSLRALQRGLPTPFSELIRGPSSLGALMESRGYAAVPSVSHPSPGAEPYFTGGYSTARHGSRDGGVVSGIQIEHWLEGLRDTEANRRAYAAQLADALVEYLARHFGFGAEEGAR